MSKLKLQMYQGVVAERDLTVPDLMGAWGMGEPALIDGKPGVAKGTVGTVVELFEDIGDVAVEFFDAEGETIDVGFIPESYVRALTPEEEKESRLRWQKAARD